jgi:hypothetical protein
LAAGNEVQDMMSSSGRTDRQSKKSRLRANHAGLWQGYDPYNSGYFIKHPNPGVRRDLRAYGQWLIANTRAQLTG